MISLILDQGLPRRAAPLLVQAGYDCVHVGDLGMAAATDTAIIEVARARAATIVTLDADFAAIAARTSARTPSIVHLRLQHLHVQAATDLLLRVLPQVADDLAAGSVVSVTSRGIRVRRLPLPSATP